MPLTRWFRPPLRTLTMFLGLVVVLGGALAWLGWQVIDSDRQLERSRAQERLSSAADRIAATLRQRITDVERLATMPGLTAAGVPAGVVVVRMGSPGSKDPGLHSDGVLLVQPEGVLVFQPIVPLAEAPPPGVFDAAEVLENQRADLAAAAAAYRALARSSAPAVRAGALARLARTLRKMDRTSGSERDARAERGGGAALAAYADLAQLDRTPVFGLPAALQAAEGRCSVFEATGRTGELRDEATRLSAALLSGRFAMTRPAWEFKMSEARAWGAPAEEAPAERQAVALSMAADWVFGQWDGESPSSGRRGLRLNEAPVFAAWSAAIDRLDAVVAGPEFLQSIWSQAVANQTVAGGLLDEDNQLVAGVVPEANATTVRVAAVPGLAWTLALTSAGASSDAAAFAGRRLLLLAGVAMLGVVLVAGSFFITRSIARERAVARLQTEFVSAVSHEFRTPLTVLRQLSELLAKGRVPAGDQQRTYDLLSAESERLQRLVESLLDFGRVQAGAFTYDFTPLDGADLVRDEVETFRHAAASRGFQVELDLPATAMPIRADREALGLALRNLLDNAVKYSGGSRVVWVDAAPEDGHLSIRVRDRGIGIPPAEQATIFKEFVRGAGSREAGIKGTGIGLTLASHIVAAHHGEIRVDSAPGQGSTFTIRLPLESA